MSKNGGENGPPPDDDDFVVVGAQMAEAAAAQRRHEAEHGPQSSPLRDVKYTREAVCLWRWAEAPQDEALASAVKHYCRLDEAARASMRSSLTMDDFYTVWTFARRRCLAALRTGDPGKIKIAFSALAMIDLERIDWRDVYTASYMARYTGQRLGADVVTIAEQAARLAEPAVAAAIAERANKPIRDLAGACGYRVVDTPEGVAFFEDDDERFAPESNLIALGFRTAQMLERDSYGVEHVTVACELPSVWLSMQDGDPVFAKIRRRVRGCVLIHARPRDEPPPGYEGQFLMVYLAEAAKEADAGAIAEAAQNLAMTGVTKFGVASQRLCAVAIATSSMHGVPALEDARSLERFRDRIALLMA